MPGSRLLEADICKWLEVSRTPVREAIRVLESERLVEIKPNKGTYVRKITFEELDEIIEFRALIEVYCIRKFLSFMNEDDLIEMESILKKLDNFLSQKDYSSHDDLAIDFHGYYISKCRNELIHSVFSNLRNSIRFAQSVLLKNIEYREKAQKEHKEIMEAIKERDPDKCEGLLRKHLEAGYLKNKESFSIAVESQKET